MYAELLRIKVHREQAAAQALRRQQCLVEQQAHVVQQARAEAATFQEYRIQQEQRLFANIKGQLVALRVIEAMNQQIAVLREQEALMATRILDEEKRLKEAKQTLEEARHRYLATVREHEKFDQLVAMQREIEAQEHLRREEAELEEIASMVHQARQEARRDNPRQVGR